MSKHAFEALIALSVISASSMTFGQDAIQPVDTQSAEVVHESWPRFLGNRFEGAAEPVVDIDWTAEPRLVWALPVGLGYGLGTVDQGRYFHFDGAFDGQMERLSCVDFATGKTIWRKATPLQFRDMLGYESGPRSSATVFDGRIYTMGVVGRLTCRDQQTGDEIWTVDTNNTYSVVPNFFGAAGAPLIVDDQVIVMVGGSPVEDQRIAPGRLDRVSPNGTALIAFDRITGKELWKAGDDLASYSSPRTMKLGDDVIVLMFARDHLLAVDPASGKQLWKFRHRADIVESVNAMVPIVRGDQVFISECYAVGSVLLKVSRDKAKVVWQDTRRDRNQKMRVHWSNPALIDGHLFGCSGRNAPDSDFRCIDFNTGEVKWQDQRRARSSVTAVGDHLVVLEEKGKLQIMKASTERMNIVAEWDLAEASGNRPAIAYPCWAAPIVIGDKLLIRGDEKVLCLQLKRDH